MSQPGPRQAIDILDTAIRPAVIQRDEPFGELMTVPDCAVPQ